jgi:hypothetical protein
LCSTAKNLGLFSWCGFLPQQAPAVSVGRPNGFYPYRIVSLLPLGREGVSVFAKYLKVRNVGNESLAVSCVKDLDGVRSELHAWCHFLLFILVGVKALTPKLTYCANVLIVLGLHDGDVVDLDVDRAAGSDSTIEAPLVLYTTKLALDGVSLDGLATEIAEQSRLDLVLRSPVRRLATTRAVLRFEPVDVVSTAVETASSDLGLGCFPTKQRVVCGFHVKQRLKILAQVKRPRKIF